MTPRAAGAGDTPAPGPAPPRAFAPDLDRLPFPARDLLPNAAYIRHGRRRYGSSVTTVMSTRGCPFACEFCSNVVFGDSYRARSPVSVVDEVEQALALGYDRISFADDVFTLERERVVAICDEIRRRGLRFPWECLARVDSVDEALAREMRRAGCTRVYFGIESGNDDVLRLMNKRITAAEARDAVEAAHRAGLEVGAFFILFYPGETDDTVLETLRFAGSLPLDYLGLSMPYPLPGTALHERLRDRDQARRAAGRQLHPQPGAHLRRRLLGPQDAPRHRQGPRAVRDEAPAGPTGAGGPAALRGPHRQGAAPHEVRADEAPAGRRRAGAYFFAANARIVSSIRRLSHASSISDG